MTKWDQYESRWGRCKTSIGYCVVDKIKPETVANRPVAKIYIERENTWNTCCSSEYIGV